MTTFIAYLFASIVGLRGAAAIVRGQARTGAYAALPPITGGRALAVGVSNMIGAAGVLLATAFTMWPAELRTGLLWGGFFLVLVMETIGVVWARQQKGNNA
jgi:hypothetical protein